MHLATRILGVAILTTLASTVFTTSAIADVPNESSYQGLLLDSGGLPLNDTPNIFARIYDDPVSTAPADLLYEEVHLNVPVVDGVFDITLGQGSFPNGTFDASTFANPDTWLEIEVDGEILTPRQKFQTVAYSFQAQQCVDAANAALLDGQTAADIVANAQTGLTFADIAGEAADGQIPAAIARDAEVFAIVISNDGSGSGLDADLLDGLSAGEIIANAQTGLTFAIIGGVLADGQIPASIARDNEIFPTVLGNDGPGSGLNADLLDNLSSASFHQQGGLADVSTLRAFDGGNITASLSGSQGDLVLGGGSDDGDLLMRDTDGTTTTVSINGATGDLILGGGNDDGDIFLRGATGLNAISMSGSFAGVTIGGTGNPGDLTLRDTNNAVAVDLDAATGDVTNKLDGDGLVKGWARINADGTVASCFRCSTLAANTGMTSTGNYEVDFTFASDIRDRPWTCSLGNGEVTIVTGRSIYCVERFLDPSSIFVNIRDAAGTNVDSAYTVVVY